MILHGSYTSPYARHCRIALMSSELDWQFEDTDYAGSAAGSPSKRVPFLSDGDLNLTDSTSILMHIRGLQKRSFIAHVAQMELYTMANTAMDSAINLFLLERDGLTPANTPYLERQKNRVESLLAVLEKMPEIALGQSPAEYDDSQIRLGCFLDWAQFRERINLSGYVKLLGLVAQLNDWELFSATSPDSI